MFTSGNTQNEEDDACMAPHPDKDRRANTDSDVNHPMAGDFLDDEESGGWLGSISTDFRSMAMCFKETTMPVFGGVISLVRNTAMAVAAEIAQLEQDGEFHAGHWRNHSQTESLSLPWEIQQAQANSNDVPPFVTDRALMDLILALSVEDATFSTPYKDLESQYDSASGEVFALDVSRLALIQRLVNADENLAKAHSRLLGGRHDYQEVVFWRNYFHHCDQTRERYMKDRLSRKNQSRPDSSSSLNQLSESSSGMLSASSDEYMVVQQDDSSLIPASVTDDSSCGVRPAPNSGNSLLTTRSWGDIVLVGRDSDYIDDGE